MSCLASNFIYVRGFFPPLISLVLFWDLYATYSNSQCYTYRNMEGFH